MADSDDVAAEYCSRIFQIRKTVWQMMSDRGYSVRSVDLSENISTFKRNCTENGVVADPGRLIIRVQRVRHFLCGCGMSFVIRCYEDSKMTRMKECGSHFPPDWCPS
jgi:hypothetical protein